MKSFGASLLFLLVFAGCNPYPEVSAPDQKEVRRILEDHRFDWVTIETANTRIHFPSGSYAETRRSHLPARAEESRRTVLSRLSVTEYPELLHLFYVDSRQDMEKLTGSPVTGFSYYDDQAIVAVFNDGWRAFERHELTHTVTLSSWTPPAGPAVVEGLATYVDGLCGGYENGRVLRTILDLGLLIPMQRLVRSFRQQDDLIAYLQAAGIIEFMVQRQGSGAVALLWDRGLRASPALLRTSHDAFLEEFEHWLTSTYDPVPTGAWEPIRANGCGIESRPAG